ncbi:right-handed parallel beta-helix repeat-containing protein [Paenibacillus sp. HB172176]|uniref:alpha-1,3-galactosidase-related protein n=1 Tax=Paenibacillus sp. HB172176 TaxID=2493690 RepID=UPI00143A71C4|nr:right-handed parallel beta-helix repeat-containing protein [Paenibacillus sp. HB172176]
MRHKTGSEGECKAARATIEVNAATYGLREGEDAVPALRRALDDAKRLGAARLDIASGTYALKPDFASERHCYISNNDAGMKRIAFLLEEFDHFELDANGSLFVCEGMMVPFFITRCRHIALHNFRLDWEKPFFFQGTVVASHPEEGSFDLRVLDECAYEIRKEELIFRGKPAPGADHWKQWPAPLLTDATWEQNMHWNMWFDERTGRPLYQEGKYQLEPQPRVEQLQPGVVRFHHACSELPSPGMTLVVKGKKEPNRASPAIVMSESVDLSVERVTVHHAGGMGLIGQRCEDVTLRQFEVRLPPDSQRICSTTADATHFNMCKGSIVFEDCYFENMLDDLTNIHGSYVRVDRAVDSRTLLCRFMHKQQAGLRFADAGDQVRLFTRDDLQVYAMLDVEEVREYNAECFAVAFRQPVDKLVKPDSVADNLTWQPEVEMRRCTVRNNRARCILLQTRRRVLIEHNHFECSSFAGLSFGGDAGLWWEADKVEDVLIRHNMFKDIHGPIIHIAPRIDTNVNPQARYHRNIRVEQNEIEAAHGTLVRAHAVDGFRFVGNDVRTGSRTEAAKDKPNFAFTASSDVLIADNRVEWESELVIAGEDSSDIVQHGNVCKS